MKKLLLVLFAFSFISFLSAQDKPKAEPLQYPFDEIGTESTRGVFGLDDRKEVKDAKGIADYVRATAVMIPKINIKDNRVYGETLREFTVDAIHRTKNCVLLMDEPESALSLRNQYRLIDEFKKSLKRKVQVIIATHCFPVISGVDEVFNMDKMEWVKSDEYILSQKT